MGPMYPRGGFESTQGEELFGTFRTFVSPFSREATRKLNVAASSMQGFEGGIPLAPGETVQFVITSDKGVISYQRERGSAPLQVLDHTLASRANRLLATPPPSHPPRRLVLGHVAPVTASCGAAGLGRGRCGRSACRGLWVILPVSDRQRDQWSGHGPGRTQGGALSRLPTFENVAAVHGVELEGVETDGHDPDVDALSRTSCPAGQRRH